MLAKLRRSFGHAIRTVSNRKVQGFPVRVPFMIIGICALLLMALPALAAVELAYFSGRSEPDSLVLEWASIRELNLARWDIYCKDELAPPSAYHLIGAVEAQGGPNQGHAYSFPVPELTPGLAYCFRLDEITVDGTPRRVIRYLWVWIWRYADPGAAGRSRGRGGCGPCLWARNADSRQCRSCTADQPTPTYVYSNFYAGRHADRRVYGYPRQ